MMSTNRLFSLGWLPVSAAVAVLLTGCTTQEVNTPTPVGVSEQGVGMLLTASPEFLPRDGSSMSIITVRIFDENGKPVPGYGIHLDATAGTLSATEVPTGNDGSAQITFIAPGLNVNVSTVRVSATPIARTNLQNANPRYVDILVTGPSIPSPAFTFEPVDAAVGDIVSFDASSTRLGTATCGNNCTYSWDFGDGSSATGVGASHTFGSAGVFNVTLTATSLAGGTSASATRAVRIAIPAPPEALLSTNPSSPTAGQTIIFSSSSVVPPGVSIVRHVWELDNGSPAVDTGSTSSYTLTGGYPATTTHSVTLTITDNYGRTSRSEPRTIDIP